MASQAPNPTPPQTMQEVLLRWHRQSTELINELTNWRANRARKHYETGTLDRTIAFLAELRNELEAAMKEGT